MMSIKRGKPLSTRRVRHKPHKGPSATIPTGSTFWKTPEGLRTKHAPTAEALSVVVARANLRALEVRANVSAHLAGPHDTY